MKERNQMKTNTNCSPEEYGDVFLRGTSLTRGSQFINTLTHDEGYSKWITKKQKNQTKEKYTTTLVWWRDIKLQATLIFFLEVEKNLLRNFNMSVGGKISSPGHYQNLAMQ
jgi:hypothetical protein